MMTMRIRRSGWLAIVAAAPAALHAQELPRPLPSQQQAAPPTMMVGPQIQRIETASAVSTELLGAITSVRELPDGRVLVNDGARRRLVLMDTTLTTASIVLDSLSEIANAYGTRPGALVPARGDTTFFIDPASLAIVVLDEHGKAVRVRSIWRAEHAMYATSTGTYGFAGADTRGRIVYRVPARPAPPAVPPPSGVPYFPPQPDSAFIVAVDLDTRRLDTLAAIRIPKRPQIIRQTREGSYSFDMMVNPLPTEDQWAVRPDGSVAIVRWLDYRIETLDTRDGSWSSSPKLPYEWQRLTDEDKRRLVDSTRVVQMKQRTNGYVMEMIGWVNMNNRPYPPGFTVPEDFAPFPGLMKDWILPPGLKLPDNYMYACAPGQQPQPSGAPVTISAPPGAPAGPGASAAPTCTPGGMFSYPPGYSPPMPTLRPVSVLEPSELPDYRPPLPTGSLGAVRADYEGNLWIRTVLPRPVPGGAVYDVVSREGELLHRIQLPPGYTLLGFGRGKVVYLSMRDPTGLHLARVRLR